MQRPVAKKGEKARALGVPVLLGDLLELVSGVEELVRARGDVSLVLALRRQHLLGLDARVAIGEKLPLLSSLLLL